VSRFQIIECEQRSDAWRAARLGKLCGSKAADMLAKRNDGKPAAGRTNLLTQLVLERVTGRSQEGGYQSKYMEQGTEREADAAGYYEALTGRLVFPVGFLQHPTLAAGVSLDGYIGELEQPEGIVEIKCPIPATHLEYLETGVVPGDYLKQIAHALWITGAQWCDWVSFNPDFPEPLRAKLVRVEASLIDLKAYEGLVEIFLREVDAKEASVRKLMQQRTEAA
jgi:hypothetical protein